MTTPSSKPVTRVTVRGYTGRLLGTKARKILVTISGDLILLRQQRCRRTEYIRIPDVFELAMWSRVKSERMTALNAKRSGRK